MTPEQIIAGLRSYVQAHPSPFRDRPLLSATVPLEDETPEPVRGPFPTTLRYGEHRCVCGGATKRHASNWWCTNPTWHVSEPRANEEDR